MDQSFGDMGSPSASDLHKRKRTKYVSKACAECKRRKIKCDGTQPCAHCSGVGVDCVYVAGKARGGARRPGQRAGANDADRQSEENDLGGTASDIELDDHGSRLLSLENTVDLILQHYPVPDSPASPVVRNAGGGFVRPGVKSGTPLTSHDGVAGSVNTLNGSSPGGPKGHLERPIHRRAGSVRGNLVEPAFYGASDSKNQLHKLKTRLCSSLPAGSHTDAELMHCERPPSPTGASKMSEIQITRPQDLPPRNEAYAILGTLFDDLMSMYPMLHGPSFFDLYAPLWGPNGDFLPDIATSDQYTVTEMGLLYAAIAAAMILMEQQGQDQCPIQAHKHYLSAKMLVVDTFLVRPADLESVQALCMLSLYFLHIEDEDASYKMTGMAIRAAFEIGLHLRSREQGQTPLAVETRRRTWWCLYLLDRRTSITLGRPIGIRDSDSDVDFPTPLDDHHRFPQQLDVPIRLEASRIPYLMSYTHFAAICGNIYDKVYGVRAAFPPDERVIIDLDSQLEQWRYALPPFLRFNQDKLGRAPKWLSKQQLFLHLRGCHVRLLLIRPFVTDAPSPDGRVAPDSFHFKMAESALRLSSEMIHTISLVKRTSDLVDHLWYPSKQYLLTAIGIIFSVVLNFANKEHSQFSAASCKADLRVALQILKDFSTKSEGSRKNLRDVQFLRYMCNQALRSRTRLGAERQSISGAPGGGGPLSASADMHSTTGRSNEILGSSSTNGGYATLSNSEGGLAGLGPLGGGGAANGEAAVDSLDGVDMTSPNAANATAGVGGAGTASAAAHGDIVGVGLNGSFPGMDESALLMSLLDTGDKGLLPTAEQYMGFGTYPGPDGGYISEPLFVGL